MYCIYGMVVRMTVEGKEGERIGTERVAVGKRDQLRAVS